MCCDDVAVSVLGIAWIGIWFFHVVQLECFYCLTSLENCSNEIMENNTGKLLWGTIKSITMDHFLSDLSANFMINWTNSFWNTICMINVLENSHLNVTISHNFLLNMIDSLSLCLNGMFLCLFLIRNYTFFFSCSPLWGFVPLMSKSMWVKFT